MRQYHSANQAVSRRSLLLGVAAFVSFRGTPAGAGWTGERFVVDRNSGIAIGGFDPIGYFLERRAVPGLPELQADWAGVTWLFANDGNRAAFRRDPATYAPRFGGYCVEAISRGLAAEGDPRLFRVHHNRLYFARDAATLALFDTTPDKIAAAAAERWPQLAATLAG